MSRAKVLTAALAVLVAAAGCTGGDDRGTARATPSASPTGSAPLRLPRLPWALVWRRPEGDGAEIVMRRPGGRETVLAGSRSGPGHGSSPQEFAVSPDGRRAVVRIATATTSRLVTIDLRSRRRRSLPIADAAAGEYALAWSPDGRTIAAVRYLQRPRCYCIELIDVRSGERRRLAPGFAIGPISWSPDGARIVAARFPRPGRNFSPLVVVDVARGTFAPVPGDPVGRSPAWSPDADLIAFRSRDGLALAAAGRPSVTLLTKGDDDRPAWTPDGRWLVFTHEGDVRVLDPSRPAAGSRSLGVTGESPAWRPRARRP